MPDIPVPPIGEIIFYQTEDGRTRVECRFAEETLWLSQALMAELFQTTPQNITQHLQSLYADGEIEEPATCKEFLQVRIEGGRQVRRALKHYNLDAILSVGYRVPIRLISNIAKLRLKPSSFSRSFLILGSGLQ